ncbi:hypothetical protein IMZ48_47725 [Candidatus Bathyarchaeota archaeon]|nr:hypothetical protein [Candidatus Bathyarchaeota archaeon]
MEEGLQGTAAAEPPSDETQVRPKTRGAAWLRLVRQCAERDQHHQPVRAAAVSQKVEVFLVASDIDPAAMLFRQAQLLARWKLFLAPAVPTRVSVAAGKG